MKTSDLVNELIASAVKYGDRELVGELQVVGPDGKPIMGKTAKLAVVADAKTTRVMLQVAGDFKPVAVPVDAVNA